MIMNRAEARLFTLSGLVELSYGDSQTEINGQTSEIATYTQRYNLGAHGDLVTPRIGMYRADVGFTNQRLDLTTQQESQKFETQDYRLSFDLLPLVAPLSLTAQRVTRLGEVGTVESKETITSYSAGWVVDLARVPRLVLNAQHTELDTGLQSEFASDVFSVNADETYNKTRVSAGYQYSATETQSVEKIQTHGLNLGVNSELRPGLLASCSGSYTSADVPPSAVTPGVDQNLQRSYGCAGSYHPHLNWWDANASYYYTENPFLEDFKSHSATGGANFRPTERWDINSGLRYTRFSITSSETDTYGADAVANWRPLFGLSTGLGGSYGLATLSGPTDSDTTTQNYRYSIAYARPWRILLLRSSYGITYGQAQTDPAGTESKDLSHTVSLGADNSNTTYVHVGATYNFSNVQRETTDTADSDQQTHQALLNADSSYFRDLLLRGDTLTLRAAGSYTDTTGFGLEGVIITASGEALYGGFAGFTVAFRYLLENYPTEVLQDRQTFTGEVNWFRTLTANWSLNLTLRDSLEDNRYRPDINRIEADATTAYQIGRLSLSADYRVTTFTSEDTESTTQTIFLRASRPF
jgi:hypothetical protein